MKYYLLLFVVILAGCAGRIREDAVGQPILAGYNTAEVGMESPECSFTNRLGVSFCIVQKNTDLSTLRLYAQGFYQGKVTFDGCGIHEAKNYVNSEKVYVTTNVVLQRDCVISVTVSPKFPKQDQSGVVVGSLRGHFYLVQFKNTATQLMKFDQVSESDSVGPQWRFFTDDSTSMDVRFVGASGGCETNEDLQVTLYPESPADHFVDINLYAFKPGRVRKQCFFRGVASTSQEQYLLYWVLNTYAKEFVPLPEPRATWDQTKLCVSADSNVSVIAVGNEVQLGSSVCFKSNSALPQTVRALTTAGRLAIGKWDPAKRMWEWMN